jgi:hypothetical protein
VAFGWRRRCLSCCGSATIRLYIAIVDVPEAPFDHNPQRRGRMDIQGTLRHFLKSAHDPSETDAGFRGMRQARDRREPLKPEEIRKLDAFFKRTFQNPRMEVKARPRKDDSAEVYVGDEFLGIVFKDEDDGDYNFSMAILDIDL